jgi:hypothetical protein
VGYPLKNQLKGVFPVQENLDALFLWIGVEPVLQTVQKRDIMINGAPTVFIFMTHSMLPDNGWTLWFTSHTDFKVKSSNFSNPTVVTETILSTALKDNLEIVKITGLTMHKNVAFFLVQGFTSSTKNWIMVGDINPSRT